MADLYYRDEQPDDLTPGQVDENMRRLNLQKLDVSLLSGYNAVIYKDKDGNITIMQISEDRLVGRLEGENIGGLTAGQVKTLLALGITDIADLDTELALKSDVGHTHSIGNITDLQTTLDSKSNTGHSHAIADVTDLQDALDEKAVQTDLDTAVGYFGGVKIVLKGTVTLVAGTGAVSYAGVTPTDKIRMWAQTGGANTGALYLDSIEDGVGFTIKSNNGADIAVVYYEVTRDIA